MAAQHSRGMVTCCCAGSELSLATSAHVLRCRSVAVFLVESDAGDQEATGRGRCDNRLGNMPRRTTPQPPHSENGQMYAGVEKDRRFFTGNGVHDGDARGAESKGEEKA